MNKSSQSRAKSKTRAKTAKSASAKSKLGSKRAESTAIAMAEETIPAQEESTAKGPLFTLRMQQFHKWNVWLTVIFIAQAAAVLLLSTTRDVTVMTSYLVPDPLLSGASSTILVAATHRLFELNVAFLLALFLLLAGLAHGIAASVYRKRYEAELAQGLNRVRWLEYTVTAAIIMLIVALLGGVYDVSSLLMIMGLTATMYLIGLYIELRAKAKPLVSWAAPRLAAIAGLLPAVALLIYAFGTHTYGSAHLPNYLYWLYGSMAVIFVLLAGNFYLQHKDRRGRWADYLFGERTFMVISLVAKTAVAWQIFAGLLHP